MSTEQDDIPALALEVIRAVKADGYPQFTEHEENAFRALAKALGEEIIEPVSVYEHTDKKVARLQAEIDAALEDVRYWRTNAEYSARSGSHD
jgi:dipeptidase